MKNWEDTPQQRAILRQYATARRTRALFPEGTKVRVKQTGALATVIRHVPSTNGQGGHLVVRWDGSERVSNVGPISVEPISPGETR